MSVFRVVIPAALLLLTGFVQNPDQSPSSKCWRFAFGAWTPPLDWDRAGHHGTASDLANRTQRVRDSVFARDTTATRNSPMYWERTKGGWAVVLFPSWWPVGVKVDFDSVFAEGREMTGHAIALVADAGQAPSRARARAMRCPGT
jgi:hypothetical protein